MVCKYEPNHSKAVIFLEKDKHWSPCLKSIEKLNMPMCVNRSVFQFFVTPWDCSLPGSSVQGVLPARILDWVAMPFSSGSSWPKDRTHVSSIAGRFFTIWAMWEVYISRINKNLIRARKHEWTNSLMNN